MSYTLTPTALKIGDPASFGFDGAELFDQPDFRVVFDEFERTRRSYNIHSLVIEHVESGRFFGTTYSTHEFEGFEWIPGCGPTPPDWREMERFERTVVDFRRKGSA